MNANDMTAPAPSAESTDAPPPPPPRQRADFAASAAMAHDILTLGNDEGIHELKAPTLPSKPRPVPELDDAMVMAFSFNGSPIAPDFFTSARGKGSKPKKHLWKLTRS